MPDMSGSDERDGKPLREFFGLDGGEFMRTGMTLSEWCATRDLERIANSYVQQKRHEQKRRRELVIKLAVEGTRVREINPFGSAVLESAVENVMEGDWDRVKQDIEWCTFKSVLVPSGDRRDGWSEDQIEEFQRRELELYELWTSFREILELAYAGRVEPGDNTNRH